MGNKSNHTLCYTEATLRSILCGISIMLQIKLSGSLTKHVFTSNTFPLLYTESVNPSDFFLSSVLLFVKTSHRLGAQRSRRFSSRICSDKNVDTIARLLHIQPHNVPIFVTYPLLRHEHSFSFTREMAGSLAEMEINIQSVSLPVSTK